MNQFATVRPIHQNTLCRALAMDRHGHEKQPHHNQINKDEKCQTNGI
ncbi:hypothetical protein [Acinetobacter johnsonii]